MKQGGRKYVEKKCQEDHANHTKSFEDKGVPFCAVHLDKTACWGPIPSGMMQAWPCPGRLFPRITPVTITYEKSIVGKTFPNHIPRAVKTCAENGKWTTLRVDMSRCYLDTNFKTWRLMISWGGNGLSFVALVIATVIFVQCKKQSTLGNLIHCHYFLALCIQIFSIVLHEAYESINLKKKSIPVCYSLLCVDSFSFMAVFSWFIMEGFYIIIINMWLFGLDSLRLWNFGIMAWGTPMYLTVIWMLIEKVRGAHRCDSDKHKPKAEIWFLDGFLLFSLLIGFGISCFCIHKLYGKGKLKRFTTKETTTNAQENFVRENSLNGSESGLVDSENNQFENKEENHKPIVNMPISTRKRMSSYLMVMAYYIGYTLLLYIRVPRWLKQQWLLGVFAYKSLQGFVVALLFCFLNYEVRIAIANSFRTWRETRRGCCTNCSQNNDVISNYSLES